MKKQDFLKGSVILIASAIIAKVIGAFFKIPLTNTLGGTGMGYFSSAYGLFLPVYAVTVTGLTTAIAKQVAEQSAFGQYRNVRRIKNISLLLFSVIGLIGSLFIGLLSKPFAISTMNDKQAFVCIMLIAPSVLFGCIMSVYRGYYEGLKNMYPTAVSQLIEALVKLFCGLGLCLYTAENPWVLEYFPQGTELVTACSAMAVLGITLSSFAGMFFLIIRDKFGGDGISKSMIENDKTVMPRKTILRQIFSVLIPVSVGSLVTNLTSLTDLLTIMKCLERAVERFPQYFAENFMPTGITPTEFPNFVYGSFNGLAITVFNLVPSITNMFGKGVIPSVAEAHAEKNIEKLAENSRSALKATAFIAVPSGLGMCFLSRQILLFLYPSRTAEILVSYRSLSFLGIAVILLCLSFPVFSMLQAVGRADLPVKIMLVGVVVKLAGNLVLVPVPEINVSGASISTTLCYAVILVMSLVCFVRETGVKLHIAKIFLPVAYSSVLCTVSAVLCNNLTSATLGNSLSLILSVGCGGIIYLVSMFLLR